MAESKGNILTKGLSGTLGGQVVFKKYGDRIIVSKVPDMSRVKKSESQKRENSKFREAIYYAKGQMADPVSKAEYKAKAKDLQKAHNVAIADFYNPPEIRNVDTSGMLSSKRIQIYAWDDFKVVKVVVELYGSNNALLEEGDAQELSEWNWEYKVTSVDVNDAMKLIVKAFDKPGNMTVEEINIK